MLGAAPWDKVPLLLYGALLAAVDYLLYAPYLEVDIPFDGLAPPKSLLCALLEIVCLCLSHLGYKVKKFSC